MARFLHSADWQLGMTRHFLSGEAQVRFSAARLDVIEQMGSLAVEEGCRFVVVCGDVFESNQVERQVLLRAFERMAAFPEVTFFLLPGNHDTLDAASIYRSPTFVEHQPDNVKVLDGPTPVEAVPGVELIPAPWPNKHPTIDLVNAACEGLEPTDALRIVVGHGAVDSMSPSPDDPKLIGLAELEKKIESGLIHYVALGDRHSTTDVGTTGRVWYAGAPEPTDYTETDPGNVLVVVLDTNDVSVEARQLGTWRFVSRDWHLSTDEDLDALEDWLAGLDDKDRAIVKFSLVGQVSVAQKARIDDILDHNADLLGALETWERHTDLVVIPDDADLDHFALSGFAHDALLDLRSRAESGNEAIVARDALALLYRLVGSHP
jgi:DNA repair exonuclease SbcCD nuclease subunit